MAEARVVVVEDAETIRVVMLDVMLPGRDGFALLEAVRQTSMAGW